MAEASKPLYIVVVDKGDDNGGGDEGRGRSTFRYTRPVLQSALQLMGCKARHAFKISKRVFARMKTELSPDTLRLQKLMPDATESTTGEKTVQEQSGCSGQGVVAGCLDQEIVETSHTMPFELYKRLTTVVVTREMFLKVTCGALSEYKYVGPNQRADLVLACRIRERKESVTVLLCGTSGCGKSTLSSLLGSRLGVTNVISTDSIRHMMRSFVDEKQNPLLWASTYHAGECLDPVAVAKAKAKRRAKKLAVISHSMAKKEQSNLGSSEKSDAGALEQAPRTDLIGKKQMAIEGFKAQSEMVIDSLDRLITAWEDRKESVVVEGVHLSLNFVMGLMKKHPSIIPFMIYITNEDKHMERFAVRAKYMTLDPAKNKYVKYIRNIRTIQENLCNRADKHLVPKVNNTNVDRSVAAIHATVFSCLRRREAGEHLYDFTTNTVPIVQEEYRNQCTANSLSSKGMFQLIQRKDSSRHLMALLNTDGSVAKAWPVESGDGNWTSMSRNSNERFMGGPMYGPLQIGKAEPVNLQFGNYGISAWPSDTGGTSHTGSIDDSRADGTDTGSRYYSSCCSSPRMSDGPAKELKVKEGISVSGSDEEADDPPDMDSDEDLSDLDKKEIHEELEGSVDEDSTKSDEEYEDLAMRDGQENGYWTDNDEDTNKAELTVRKKLETNDSALSMGDGGRYQQNLDLFQKLSERFAKSSLLSKEEMNADVRTRTRSLSDTSRIYSHSLSIPMYGESVYREPILSAAPRW